MQIAQELKIQPKGDIVDGSVMVDIVKVRNFFLSFILLIQLTLPNFLIQESCNPVLPAHG
jgi:hypothetical protein